MTASKSPPAARASSQADRRASLATGLGAVLARLRRIPSWLWRAEAALRGVQMPGAVEFLGRPIISVSPGSEFVLAGGNHLFSSRRCNPLGNAQPCVLRTLAPGAVLQLGLGVGASSAVICAAARIEIGDGTIIGAGAMIIDNDFHLPDGETGWTKNAWATARPVSIGRGCFIGARAIVLKGVTIGNRAVVGAGAVVSCDVPPGALAVGNPARIILRDVA